MLYIKSCNGGTNIIYYICLNIYINKCKNLISEVELNTGNSNIYIFKIYNLKTLYNYWHWGLNIFIFRFKIHLYISIKYEFLFQIAQQYIFVHS